MQHALELVIRSEWRGLIAVGQKPAPQHLRIVILAQRLAPRLHLGDPLFDPLEQRGLIHLEFDHGIELEALLLEHAIECVRLRHRAWEAIQNEALARIRLIDALRNDRDHDVIGHELAAFHHLFRAHPD